MKPLAILRRPDRLSRVWLEHEDGRPCIRERPGAADAALDAAFARLSSFDPARDEDRDALARVWTETLPAPDGWPRTPLPRAVPAPAMPKATAAHPRAFRGTIHKPPKPARSRLALGAFLDRWPALVALGAASGPDPYPRTHHGPCDEASLEVLDPSFRAFVLPVLRGIPWNEVLRIARAQEALRTPLALTTAVARSTGAATSGAWLEGALTLPPALREPWLRALSEAVMLVGVDTVASLELPRLSALDGDFDTHARNYLALLAAGACPAYAASGVELSASTAHPWRFDTKPAGRGEVKELVRAIVDPLVLSPYDARYWLERIWVHAGTCREALETIAARAFERNAAFAWIRALDALERAGPDEQARRTMTTLVRAAAPDDRHLPAHLEFDFAADEGVMDGVRVKYALELARYLGNRPPNVQGVVELLGRTRLSERALDACVAMTRRQNDRWRIYRGLEVLVRELPDMTVRLANEKTKSLLRTSRALGVMSSERIREVVRRAAKDEGFDPPPTLEGWRTLASEPPRRRDPLSRGLRAHLTGERPLTAAQLDRHLRLARERWDLARLTRIEAVAEQELRRPIEGATGAEALEGEALTHALALLSDAEWHRRGLTRVLRAYLAGDLDVVDRHPASRAWLARHPALDAARWREGVVLERRRGERALRLAIEQDPLEVLRLGTYVGSCLGLGGGFTADAAGVLLDVNRRVVYARDDRGRVVGRQLVAVSEACELVCYSPYPIGIDDATAALFREYDEALAAHLAIPLCTHDEYRVASVLSKVMWDDGIWEQLEQPSIDSPSR